MEIKDVRVTVGSNTSRKPPKIYPNTATVKEILKDQSVDYSNKTFALDGLQLQRGELDQPLVELGVTGDECMIVIISKTENAA